MTNYEGEERRREHQEIMDEIKLINAKLDPIYKIYSAATGFNQVSLLIMKAMGTIGAAILALYVVIEFFKKLGRP